MANSPLSLQTIGSYSTSNPTECDDMDMSDDDSLFAPSSPAKAEEDVDMCWEHQNDTQSLSMLPRELLLRIFRMVVYTGYTTARFAHIELAELSLVRRSWCSLARLLMHENIDLESGQLETFRARLEANSHIGALIRSLDLRCPYVDPKRLIRILKQCPMLQHLSFDPPDATIRKSMGPLRNVFDLLGAMKTFTSFDFKPSPSRLSIQFPLDILRPLTGLQHLKISGWTAFESHDKEPVTFPHLRTFALSRSKVGPTRVSELLVILRNAPRLQALALHCLDCPVESVPDIFLATTPTLRALRYQHFETGGDEVGSILTTAVQRFKQLRELRCGGSTFSPGLIPQITSTIEVIRTDFNVSSEWWDCWVQDLLHGLHPQLRRLVVNARLYQNFHDKKLFSVCRDLGILTTLPPIDRRCSDHHFLYETL
ncbi:hypothetical protein BT69DRAFT_1287619 [Atractiella rhizophila]|nr:hypothetical protein BT69DRAFT_1287619 [Atractiella rhizophila]